MSFDRAASALKWWSDAGVDTIVAEEPRNWLAPAVAKTLPAPEPEAPVTMPATLDAFQAWLAGAPFPFASPSAPRLAPMGDPASGLMVMTGMPALGGGFFFDEADALFGRMLGAIGLSRETIYLASLSPVRTPSGALDRAGERSLADIARHHIALAAPKALLLFGDACARALLGMPVTKARGRWHALATPAGEIRTLVTIKPDNLVDQLALKKLAWADLQMLMEELTP
jgi:uracil-DNA glycosylase